MILVQFLATFAFLAVQEVFYKTGATSFDSSWDIDLSDQRLHDALIGSSRALSLGSYF